MSYKTNALIRIEHRNIVTLGEKIRYQIEKCHEPHLEFEQTLNELYYDFFLLVEEELL